MTTITILIEQLAHPDHNLRSEAALSLGKLADPAALDALVRALATDADLNVREDITWSLVRHKDAALAPLIALLSDETPLARHNAAHALGKMGDPRAVDALIAALQDPVLTVLSKVVFVLGQIGDVRAIPPLVDLLGHESHEIRNTLNDVLEAFGAHAIPALSAALNHDQVHIREHAAEALGLLGDRAAIAPLTAALADHHWQVRFAALMSLSHLGGADVHSAIASAQTDPDPRVRDLAAKLTRRLNA